ncbi:hypothetical protein NA57DRAFT_78089 [Rhizodiscina lignyota]|uniref:Uncharacterized protein n=1 Tax=Rhizodiscina lignyota TaxID=1504668 RepID=A0A9P4I7L4_9PEZI|nr:hypothetical protein NA57DRAFT_78089 [Rhizodiscina lignyota]
MENLRGERFELDLGGNDAPAQIPDALASFSLVGDVLERAPSQPVPPSAPIAKSSTSGFPAHRKRTRPSTFKQRRGQVSEDSSVASSASKAVGGIQNGQSDVHVPRSFEEADRMRIDEENRQKIASMSPEEIEKERQELFSGLNPGLIEKLLKRSTIDSEPPQQFNAADVQEKKPSKPSKGSKRVAFAEPAHEQAAEDTQKIDEKTNTAHVNDDEEVTTQTSSLDTTVIDNNDTQQTSDSIHFPRPPEPPDLDPSDPSFLEALHSKYFPNLAHDPSKLSWMKDASLDDTNSPYHPSQASLPASALRFNFSGALLPPNLSRQISTSAGLHHHGDAPEAAGYTIPELAHLARSTYAPQRCMAYQTLGRILYRLGTGGFGNEHDENEEISNLPKGLWDCIEETKVLDVMSNEANREKGHLTARTYAQEAVWNWQRGGGRKRKAQ